MVVLAMMGRLSRSKCLSFKRRFYISILISFLFVIPSFSPLAGGSDDAGPEGVMYLRGPSAPLSGPPFPTQSPIMLDKGNGMDIVVGSYRFDPLEGLPELPSHLRCKAPQGYYIVQFHGSVSEAQLKTLESAGAVIENYVPNNACIVEMRPAAARVVAGLDFVRWLGPYEPAYKFIGEIPDAGPVDVRLDVFPYREELMRPEGKDTLSEVGDLLERFPTLENPVRTPIDGSQRAPLKRKTGLPTLEEKLKETWRSRIEERVSLLEGEAVAWRGEDVLHVVVPRAAVSSLARMPEVKYVSEWQENKPLMDEITSVSGIDYGQSKGYNGGKWAGYFGGNAIPGVVMDGPGFDTTHPDLQNIEPVVHDPDYHATASLGIVFGTGALNEAYRGILPNATGGFASMSGDENSVKDSNQADNGYFSSHGYYSGANDGWYDSRSNELDNDLYNDQQYVYFFGAGDVPNADGEHVTGEGCAKNVVTVGGVDPDGYWDDDGCHGPTDYGALKPDIVHYNEGVTTCAPMPVGYADFSGTSASTSIVAGMGGQFIESWLDDYFGNNPGHALPNSGSTVKAALINTADHANFGSDGIGRYEMGWGVPHNNWFWDGRGWLFSDYEDFRTADDDGGEPVEVVPTTTTWPLRITLSWYDPPGGAAGADGDTTNRLVNDLNLRVVDLNSGDVYYGNMGMLTSQATSPGSGTNPWSGGGKNPDDNYDDLNNVENVWIPSPLGHEFEIYVEGGPEVTGNQYFSLAVSGTPTVAQIWFEEDGYMRGEAPKVVLVSKENNTSPNSIDTAWVRVTSGKDPDGVALTLTETAVNSSTFEGRFFVGRKGLDGYNDGLSHTEAETGGAPVLAAYEAGDTLRVDFYGVDPAPRAAYDTCKYDGKPPRIFNVRVTGTSHTGFSAEWETDEPARCILYLPLTWNETGTKPDHDDSWLYMGNAWSNYDPSKVKDMYDPSKYVNPRRLETGLGTHHGVNIVGLYPDEDFIFYVVAVDDVRVDDGGHVGNTGRNDNAGQYYQFHTLRQDFEILVVADDNYAMWDGFTMWYYNVYYSSYFGRLLWTAVDSHHELYGEWNASREWTRYLDYFTPCTLADYWADMRAAQASGVDNIVVWTTGDMCVQVTTTIGTQLSLSPNGITDTFNATDMQALDQWKATGAANTLIQGCGIVEDAQSSYDAIQGMEPWLEAYAQITIPASGDDYWQDTGGGTFDGTGAYVDEGSAYRDLIAHDGNLWSVGEDYTGCIAISGDAFQLNGATGELEWGQNQNGDDSYTDDFMLSTSTQDGQKLVFGPGATDLRGMAGLHVMLLYADQGGQYYDTSFTIPIWQGKYLPWWLGPEYTLGSTRFEGTVYEDDGVTPIPNATVQAYAVGDRSVVLGGAKTNVSGNYKLSVTAGAYELVGFKAGYERNDTWYTGSGGGGLPTISAGQTFAGRDFTLGGAVGGLQGYVYGYDPVAGHTNEHTFRVRAEGSGHTAEAVTGSDGFYSIQDLPVSAGPYTITAYHSERKDLSYSFSGYETFVETGFTPSGDVQWRNYTLVCGAMTGQVTDGSGEPVEGARVYLWEQNRSRPAYVNSPECIRHAFTGSDGSFHLGGLSAGGSGYYLEVDANGMYTATFTDEYGGEYEVEEPYGFANSSVVSPTVEQGRATIVNVALADVMGRIYGTITEQGSGNPLSGAQVHLEMTSPGWMEGHHETKRTAYTGRDGSYSFDVHPGTYKVTFKKPGYWDEVHPGQVITDGQQLQLDVEMVAGMCVGDILVMFDWNMTQSRGNGGWSGPNDMFLTAVGNLGYTFDSWNISWNDGGAMYIDEYTDGLPDYEDLEPYDVVIFYGMDANIYPEQTSLGGPWAPAVMQYMDNGGSWIHCDHEWRYGAGAATELMTDYMKATYVDDGTDEASNANVARSICPPDDPVGGTDTGIPPVKALQGGTSGSPGSGYQYEDRIEGQVNLFDDGADNVMAIRTEGEVWKAAWFGFAVTDYTDTVDTADDDFRTLINNFIMWGSNKPYSPPVISEPAVSPAQGPSGLAYNYTFTWTDVENDWPLTAPKLIVNPGTVLEQKFEMDTISTPPIIVTTTYDYSNVTATDPDFEAHRCVVDSASDSEFNDPNSWTELTNPQYGYISGDDGTMYQSGEPTLNRDEIFMRFKMTISEDQYDVSNMVFTWNGFSPDSDGDISLYVMNDDNGWVELLTSGDLGLSDLTLSSSISSMCQDYISDGGVVWWGVYGPYSDITRYQLDTDHVQLDVESISNGDPTSNGIQYFHELPADYFAGRPGPHEFRFDCPGDDTFEPVGELGIREGPFVWDGAAPSVTVTDKWTQAATGMLIPVNATVTDNVGVEQVRLYYKSVGSPSFDWVLMRRSPRLGVVNEYMAYVPAQDSAGTLEYYVRAWDENITSNEASDPAGAPGSYYTIQIDSSNASLFGGGVDPPSGDPGTIFNFTVTYKDTSGAPPQSVEVWIEYVGWNMMTWDSGVHSEGAVYSYPWNSSGHGGQVHYDFRAFSDEGTLIETNESYDPITVNNLYVPLPVLNLGVSVDEFDRPVLNWTLQTSPANQTDDIRVYRSPDKDFNWSTDVVAILPPDATSWTDTGVSSGTYYYYVRAYNVVGLSDLSTMGVYHQFVFTYNAGIGNDNWISLPHTSQYKTALDIINAIEGGTGTGTDVFINYIGKWDPATQGVTEAYFYQQVGPPALWGWNGGTDFAINPGDCITLQLSGNTPSFTWSVGGVDVRCTVDFTYNAGVGNDNWLTVPWTGQYSMASDIVLDLEGQLVAPCDLYINYIGKWDTSNQGVTEAYFYREVGPSALWGWTGGADFAIEPGDGITIQLSGNTASFNWQQLLVSVPMPDATYP